MASSGFGEGGSALDLLRDSADQGALTKATPAQQGNITEAAIRTNEATAAHRIAVHLGTDPLGYAHAESGRAAAAATRPDLRRGRRRGAQTATVLLTTPAADCTRTGTSSLRRIGGQLEAEVRLSDSVRRDGCG